MKTDFRHRDSETRRVDSSETVSALKHTKIIIDRIYRIDRISGTSTPGSVCRSFILSLHPILFIRLILSFSFSFVCFVVNPSFEAEAGWRR